MKDFKIMCTSGANLLKICMSNIIMAWLGDMRSWQRHMQMLIIKSHVDISYCSYIIICAPDLCRAYVDDSTVYVRVAACVQFQFACTTEHFSIFIWDVKHWARSSAMDMSAHELYLLFYVGSRTYITCVKECRKVQRAWRPAAMVLALSVSCYNTDTILEYATSDRIEALMHAIRMHKFKVRLPHLTFYRTFHADISNMQNSVVYIRSCLSDPSICQLILLVDLHLQNGFPKEMGDAWVSSKF